MSAYPSLPALRFVQKIYVLACLELWLCLGRIIWQLGGRTMRSAVSLCGVLGKISSASPIWGHWLFDCYFTEYWTLILPITVTSRNLSPSSVSITLSILLAPIRHHSLHSRTVICQPWSHVKTARFASVYLLFMLFNLAFWSPIRVHSLQHRSVIRCFSSPSIVFSIPMNGNDPPPFGAPYLEWKLCGHNSLVLPYQWRRSQAILVVSNLKFPCSLSSDSALCSRNGWCWIFCTWLIQPECKSQ